MTNWPTWYGKTKTHPAYSKQKEEISRLLKVEIQNYVNGFNFWYMKSVLDVGCGDQRMRDLFEHLEYHGIDRETTGHDITDELTYSGYTDQSIDLGFVSLVFVCLKQDEMQKVLEILLNKCKWVFLYEETSGEEKQVAEDKWHHNYMHSQLRLQKRSKVNPKWLIYLYRGYP